MSTQGRGRPAVVAAIAAVLLWQLAAEVRFQLNLWAVDTGAISVFAVLPTASPFSFRLLLRQWSTPVFLGLVVTNVVIFVVVWLVVRAVARRGVPARGAMFLATWMAVVIGAVAATLLTLPFYASFVRLPPEYGGAMLLSLVQAAPYAGFVIGWIPALLAAALSPSGREVAQAGYPVASAPLSGYPVPPSPHQGPGPGESPYLRRDLGQG